MTRAMALVLVLLLIPRALLEAMLPGKVPETGREFMKNGSFEDQK